MKVQLSISMLISDRRNTLTRSLDSILPILKAIPSELILVYTGKESETLAIARRYTDNIIPFTWCNDFSKARNKGLEAASGEWFMLLDDDEWFEDTEPIIQFFQRGSYRSFGSASYIQRNYLGAEAGYTDSSVFRLTRLDTGVKFKGSIHEQLEPVLMPRQYFDVFVHHYGYAGKVSKEKTDRNLPLLLEQADHDPRNLKNYAQIAQEYIYRQEYEKAEEWCRKGLSLDKKAKADTTLHWIVAYLPRCILAQGEGKRAAKECRRLLESEDSFELSSLQLHLTIVDVCKEMGRTEELIYHVKEFRKLMVYMNNHTHLWQEQQQAGLNELFIRRNECEAYVKGAAACLETEDDEGLEMFLRCLPWGTEQMTDTVYRALEKQKRDHLDKEELLLKAYGNILAEDSYLDLQKAFLAEHKGNSKEIETYFLRNQGKVQEGQGYQWLLLAIYHGFSLDTVLKIEDIESWEQRTNIMLLEMEKDLPLWMEKIEASLSSYPLHYPVLLYKLLEKYLMNVADRTEEEDITSYLEKYCKVVVNYYQTIFKETIFNEENLSYLPKRYIFAVKMLDALEEKKDGKYTESIHTLRGILDQVPSAHGLIREVMALTQRQFASEQINPEMRAIGEQVKQSVTDLIQKKQFADAYAIVNQLLALLPDDLEVLRLKQQILRGL